MPQYILITYMLLYSENEVEKKMLKDATKQSSVGKIYSRPPGSQCSTYESDISLWY